MTQLKRKIPRPSAGELTVDGIIEAFAQRLSYSVGRDEHTLTEYDAYEALAFAVRDQLIDRWFVTQQNYYRQDVKRVYYLSLEFLLGRSLVDNILNLGAVGPYATAMEELGYRIEQLETSESDAGLGNGGLGRLAACFLDSAATLGLPFYGYGIRYEYGIFRQKIVEGHQVEAPDNWLRYRNPWEIPRPDVLFPVRFFGRSEATRVNGELKFDWVDAHEVYAMAYDIPIAGYRNGTVNTLRLWAAKSSRDFDLEHFNAGNYVRAVEDKFLSENISKVLYPPDDQYAGKELRLKQQYFFVSATLQDMFRRFLKSPRKWSELPEKVAIQLNDTHPAIAIPELMRMLIDEHDVDWATAWSICEKVFGYTNHTILAEALEAWPMDFLGRLLPRHLQIIEEIDRRLRAEVRSRHPKEPEREARMAILDHDHHSVRMTHLAIVGSHSVNGVAKLHTEILKDSVFRDFDEFFPGRFNNKTNGITPRRWLLKANPHLADLISDAIGDGWVTNLEALRQLEAFVDDESFRERWIEVKRRNRHRLANWARATHGIVFDPESLIDTQIKRIHEYKRQLLNALHVITLYHRIADGEDLPPRTVLFGGKAAPAYFIAKRIIRLIGAIGETVNADPMVSRRLRVAFVPNYDVTSAEIIFPATDLSEQISTAGTEASGTGNMKAALNGALIIGTLDGANIEIRQEIGEENMFIFGHTAGQIAAMKESGYEPSNWIAKDPFLARAIEEITTGPLGKKHPGMFDPLVEIVARNDRYFHCADFPSYRTTQDEAADLFSSSEEEWVRRTILSVARMGRFSSDRTVREYGTKIWGV